MPSRILVVTADRSEADVITMRYGVSNTPGCFLSGNCEVSVLVTGIGGIATAWAMAKWLSMNPRPDMAINAGIAGSYRDDIGPGDVVLPVSDLFADAGIETDKGFITLGEAGIGGQNSFPFRDGKIFAENRFVDRAKNTIRPVNAITVNTVTGTAETIEKIRLKFDPDIETMEGAAFFYICSREKLPFVALRSVSNRVEPRNKNKWEIALALNNLADEFDEFLKNTGL